VLVCTRNVAHVTNRLKVVLELDEVLAGGGKAKLLRKLPAGVRLGCNAETFVGGFR